MTAEQNKGPLIYVVACEASGDQLGALLIEGLKAETGGRVRFSGVGGPLMRAAGLESLFDPKDLALLGIFEVLPKARLVLNRVAETLSDIKTKQPDILVTIDSWGFTGRIHQRLSREGSLIPRVRYVAPQVWAWRPGRAKQLARWIHHLLTLFPFEPPYFERHGLPATWVGHPVAENGFDKGDGKRFRTRHSIGADQVVLGLLPGSRKGEVTKLLPVFKETLVRLSHTNEKLHVVLPTVEAVADLLEQELKTSPIKGMSLVTEADEKRDAFAACDAALAASGTVSLELAAASVPHVIGYRVNPLSALAFRLLAKTKRVNLVNILLDRDVVPERLQEKCRPEVLAGDLNSLLKDEQTRVFQLQAFKDAMRKLAPADSKPSQTAAKTVLRMIRG
jgi:lipid-A-disaccharide synthase